MQTLLPGSQQSEVELQAASTAAQQRPLASQVPWQHSAPAAQTAPGILQHRPATHPSPQHSAGDAQAIPGVPQQ
jgi:hypothetical protein